MRNFFIVILGVVFLSSCDSDFVYGKDIDINPNGWHKDSILIFETDSLVDLPEVIKIGFNIRNTTDYFYRNMYLFVEIQVPGRENPIRDTLDHMLMTPDGYWLEDVEGANIKESIAYYPYAIKDPAKGVYRIKVQQGMRPDILEEVISVGARIEKHDL